MSIANEIVRLKGAKEAIKFAINKHGVSVADTATLDLYPEILENVPYAVKGTFTPEKDTDTFELSGLDYEPQALALACRDLEDNIVNSAIVLVFGIKDNLGGVYYYSPVSDKKFALLKSTSEIISWNHGSVKVKILSGNTGYFKKGYTYSYVITGGFAQ